MTDVLVVRMDRKQISRLDAAARQRSVSRSKLVRQALDTFLKEEPPQKGVGWVEHFKKLRESGQRVETTVVDEVIRASRSR